MKNRSDKVQPSTHSSSWRGPTASGSGCHAAPVGRLGTGGRLFGNPLMFGLALFVPAGGASFYGTAGDDVIIGTDGNDIIHGEGGRDVICAGGGDDLVWGGEGNDHIDGQA